MVGVYSPREKEREGSIVQDVKIKREAGQEEARGLLTPSRKRRKDSERHRRRRRNRFNIPFDPQKPLDLVSSLGSRIQEYRQSFNKRQPRQHRDRRRQRGRQSPPRRRPKRRRHKEEGGGAGRPPYKFLPPDFSLPPLPEYAEEAAREAKRTPVPENPYVPKFMKELLARAFLKNPESYIAYLRFREEQRKRGIHDEEDESLGYIQWINDEPYYKTPPPPLATQEELQRDHLLAAVVAPARKKAQRPFRATRNRQGLRRFKRRNRGQGRRKRKNHVNDVEAGPGINQEADFR